MSTHELSSKAQELQELKRLKEDLEAEIAAVESKIKDSVYDKATTTKKRIIELLDHAQDRELELIFTFANALIIDNPNSR